MKNNQPSPGLDHARLLTKAEIALTGLPEDLYVMVDFSGQVGFLREDAAAGLSNFTGINSLCSEPRIDLELASQKLLEAWNE